MGEQEKAAEWSSLIKKKKGALNLATRRLVVVMKSPLSG